MGTQFVKTFEGFTRHDLDDRHTFWVGTLPDRHRLDPTAFEALWRMHPAVYHEIKMLGRLVKTPRWQQAYGVDYHYTGRVNRALPIPPLLAPLLGWAKENIDERLNGILVNWYDGSKGHYIGRHRDSTTNLVEGAPIVTISFGEERVFRLRPYPYRGVERKDFVANHGGVFIMPYETNLAWGHEVPDSRECTDRRISVTLRCFIVS